MTSVVCRLSWRAAWRRIRDQSCIEKLTSVLHNTATKWSLTIWCISLLFDSRTHVLSLDYYFWQLDDISTSNNNVCYGVMLKHRDQISPALALNRGFMQVSKFLIFCPKTASTFVAVFEFTKLISNIQNVSTPLCQLIFGV